MRVIKVSIPLIIWDLFLWFIYNGHLLEDKIWILFNKQRIYDEFYIGSTYFNVGSYLLVSAITLVLIAEYCLKSEIIPILMRCQSREMFVSRRWKVFLGVGALYTGVHFAVGYIASIAVFGNSFIQTRSTAMFYGISAITLFFFLERVCVVYTMFRDVFQKKIFAMLGIVGMYIGEYFIGYWILSDIWMPCKDLSLGGFAYFNTFSGVEFFAMITRQICITAFTIVLSEKCFLKKDVIRFEV